MRSKTHIKFISFILALALVLTGAPGFFDGGQLGFLPESVYADDVEVNVSNETELAEALTNDTQDRVIITVTTDIAISTSITVIGTKIISGGGFTLSGTDLFTNSGQFAILNATIRNINTGSLNSSKITNNNELFLYDVTVTGGGRGLANNGGIAQAFYCTFDGNKVLGNGAAVNNDGELYAANCTFSNNTASATVGSNSYYGGAVFGGSSSKTNLSLCSFDSNSAYYGGAVCSTGLLIAHSCSFTRNTATYSNDSHKGGGAISNYAGNAAVPGRIYVLNSVFYNNTARRYGTAVFVSEEILYLVNCTFAENIGTTNQGSYSVTADGNGSGVTAVNTVILDGIYPGNSGNNKLYHCITEGDIDNVFGTLPAKEQVYGTDIMMLKVLGDRAAASGGALTYYKTSGSALSIGYSTDGGINIEMILDDAGSLDKDYNRLYTIDGSYYRQGLVGACDYVYYTLSFDVNGGDPIFDEIVISNTIAEEPEDPQIEGGDFAGWYSDEELLTPYAFDTPVTTDTTIHAKWDMRYHTVTFDSASGSAVAPQKVTEGSLAAEPAVPVRNEFEFTGWFTTDGALYNFKAPVYEDIELVAHWTEKGSTCYIYFYDHEGNLISTVLTPKGQMPVPPAAPAVPSTAAFTFEFAGWEPELATASGIARYDASYNWIANTYDVHWLDWDGTELETDKDVEYGSDPEYDSTEPAIKADAQYTYSFEGWLTEGGIMPCAVGDLPMIEGETSFTATYSSVVNSYTVTWKNGDDIISTQSALYGTKLTYGGIAPTQGPTPKYSYSFTGWTDGKNNYGPSDEIEVKGDTVLTATFGSTVNNYNITWLNADGSILTQAAVAYDAIPAYGGTPALEPTATTVYAFKEWSPAVHTVTGAATYTAVYTESPRLYTVTWKDGDAVLATQSAVYNEKVSDGGLAPAKDETPKFVYTFNGWSEKGMLGSHYYPKADITVTKDLELVAGFDATVKKCTITWINYDDEILTSAGVEYDTVPVYPLTDPTHPDDANYSYTFVGWTPSVQPVSGSATYKAIYTQNVQEYTVTWVNADDNHTQLGTDTVKYGKKPQFTGTPVLPATAQYTFTFAGWSDEAGTTTYAAADLPTVTGNVTFVAIYDHTVNKYNIDWVNEGTVVTSTSVEYGTVPAYFGTVPTKDPEVDKVFTFDHWAPELAAVTGAATYTAVYKDSPRMYTVTWKNGNNVLATQSAVYNSKVSDGGLAPAKGETPKFVYTFNGWSEKGMLGSHYDPKADITVTKDLELIAEFDATVKKYTVTWINYNDEILTSASIEYDETPVYPLENPTQPDAADYSYTFAGWTPSVQPVSGNVTYKAIYTQNVQEYTVTWVNADDNHTQLGTDTVKYGKKPQFTGTPVLPATAQYTYSFAGWSDETGTTTYAAANLPDVKGNVTFVAIYDHTVNKYKVDWINGDTVITTASIEYGTTPTYSGIVPVKGNSQHYSYAFAGWTPEIKAVTTDAAYTATFSAIPNVYTVSFDPDYALAQGTMSPQNFTYGEQKALSANVFQADDYHFAGWATTSGGAKVYDDKATYSALGSTTLYAVWAPNTYMITFDKNNSEVTDAAVTVQYIDYLDTASLAAMSYEFDSTHYHFLGWSEDKNADVAAYDDQFSYVMTGNTTLYAIWEAQPIPVTFNANDGSGLTTTAGFIYKVSTQLPQNVFTKPGSMIVGWNENAGASVYTIPADGSITVTEPKTLYAIWDNVYTISFDANGGDGTMTPQIFYGDAAQYLKPNEFTKTGGVFLGWSLDKNATKASWGNQVSYTAAQSTTLYAIWDAADVTVTFRPNGNNVTPGAYEQGFKYGVSGKLNPVLFTREGYTFTGWNTASMGNGYPYADQAVFSTTTNVSLYALWNINHYTVSFSSNGGSAVTPQIITYGAFASEPEDPIRSGYSFAGWFSDAGLTNAFSFGGSTITTDRALYAKWDINHYTVSFSSNGGSAVTPQSITHGAFAVEPAVPVLANNSFAGWFSDAGLTNAFSFTGSAITTDTALYAKWTPTGGGGGGGSSGGGGGAAVTPATGGTTNADGSKTSTKTNSDGSTTVTTTSKDSKVTVATTTSKDGKSVTSTVNIANSVADKSTVEIPGSALEKSKTIQVSVPAGKSVEVSIPIRNARTSTVVYVVNKDGTKTLLKDCTVDADGTVDVKLDESCTLMIEDNGKYFRDVEPNRWSQDAIDFVTSREIFNGNGDGTFSPAEPMSRSMIAQVLYNLDRNAKPGISNSFKDGNTLKWFTDAVGWASSMGLVTGYEDGRFDGDGVVTREQVVTILYRYAKLTGMDTSSRGTLAFSDAGSVRDYSREAMQWAVGAGLINGENGRLRPDAPATREQLAAMIMRFVNLM